MKWACQQMRWCQRWLLCELVLHWRHFTHVALPERAPECVLRVARHVRDDKSVGGQAWWR
jgi:hypothetical protein